VGTCFLKSQESDTPDGVDHHCSSSIGVVLFNGSEFCQEWDFKRADEAMYLAKAGGRNKVRFNNEKID
jgi:GGDEF domain-containing protein